MGKRGPLAGQVHLQLPPVQGTHARDQGPQYRLFSMQGGAHHAKVGTLPKSPSSELYTVPSCKLVKPNVCFSMEQ